PTVPSNTRSAALDAGIETVTPAPPLVTRPVAAISAATSGDGGTKKSPALTPEPVGVATDSRPDVAPGGTVVAIDVLVTVSGSARTVNGTALEPEPPGVVTTIVPLVAPAGTVVVICVGVAAVTTAAVPLNVTVLLPGVVLKPTPLIVTVVPSVPGPAEKSMIET